MKKRFSIDGYRFSAEDRSGDVLINPTLPKGFDVTANEDRPPSHQKWWYRPFIKTETVEQLDRFYAERTDEYADKAREIWKTTRVKYLAAWPSGTRYETRCLDGGAWDRSTSWGMFATLAEAVECAGSRDPRRYA